MIVTKYTHLWVVCLRLKGNLVILITQLHLMIQFPLLNINVLKYWVTIQFFTLFVPIIS